MKIYISFADDSLEGFLGACVVSAPDSMAAVRRSHELKINPGGEAMCLPTPEECCVPYPMDTLLSKDEMERIDGEPGLKIRDMTDDQVLMIRSMSDVIHGSCQESLAQDGRTPDAAGKE